MKIRHYKKSLLAGAITIGFIWFFVAAKSVFELLNAEYAQEQIMRGKEILCQLEVVDVPQDSENHLDDIVSFVWYLYAIAAAKGQPFAEGMLVIQDPKGRIYNYLSSYPDIYPRISSHFKEYEGQHYGIDIPKELRRTVFLPNHKYHILFGRLDDQFTFIQPEPYGVKLKSDLLWHSKNYIAYMARRIIPGNIDTDCYRHELVSRVVKNAWKELVFSVVSDVHRAHAIIQDGLDHGIKRMLEQLNSLIDSEGDAQQKPYCHFMTAINQYDHLRYRKGREVILLNHELVT